MPLYAIEAPVKYKSIRKMFLQYVIILTLGLILANILLTASLIRQINTCHFLLGLGGIFMSFFSFFIIWQIYERINPAIRILGMACLAFTVFLCFNAVYFPVIDLSKAIYADLSMRYWLTCTLIESMILLYFTSESVSFMTNKKIASGVVLFITLGVSVYLLCFPNLTKTLFGLWYISGYTRMVIQVAVIFICLIILSKLVGKINKRESVIYRYVFLALLIKVTICITYLALVKLTGFLLIYTDILDLFYAYCILRGIFISTIIYPYEKFELGEKYLTTIFDILPIGLATYNQDMKATFINRKAQDEFRCRPNELLDLSAENIGNRFKTDTALEKQITETSASIASDIRVIKNDLGDEVEVSINAYRIDDMGFLYVLDDIKREHELKNLRLQTKIILNSIDNLVLIVDKKGRILMCNSSFESAAEMPEKDIVGMDLLALSKLLKIARKKTAEKKLRPSAFVIERDRYEATMHTPKGNKKHLVFYISPIHNIDGEVIGAINVASDITFLKFDQEKLEQNERLAVSGQVAAGMVHEIKNPLTTIKGFSQLIISKTDDEKIKKYASMIEAATNDLNKLVTNFLEFARPKPAVFEEISLNSFVESIKVMLMGHSFAKGVDINFDISSEGKKVIADENKLKQVILNIVRNAIDAMAGIENPRLKVSVQYAPDLNSMLIVIKDNGKGMSSEEKQKLGTPFYTTKEKGTGLGLSICYQIMKEHKGSIRIESEVGQGTSFILSIPCVEQV